jgi:general secretion pathway protein J
MRLPGGVRRNHGFTLMEILVALVLLTLFAVVSYRALDAVLQAQRRATAEMEHWHTLAAAFAWMESDLSNAVVRFDPLHPLSGGLHFQADQSGAVQFEFFRLLPEDADQGVERIGYRCSGKVLSRLVWPDANDPAGVPRDSTLLGGLRSCAFRFLDPNGQWLTGWPASTAHPLPRAIELDIAEANGTPLQRVMRVQ